MSPRGLASLLFGLVSCASAAKYGYNHVPVQKDSDIVASAFQEVDVELLSPAFITPEIRLPGFTEGTQGPSSQNDMGEFVECIAFLDHYELIRKTCRFFPARLGRAKRLHDLSHC
jgi:hypothetical protein